MSNQSTINKLIAVAREQEAIVIATRDRLEKLRVDRGSSRVYQNERAKLIGMVALLESFEIDLSEFEWIY